MSLAEDYRKSESSNPLTVMENSIIVPSVDKESVINQLLYLEKNGYFQNLNPQLYCDLDKDFPDYYSLTCALNEKMSLVPEIIIEEADEHDGISSRLTELIEEGLLDDIPYKKYTYLTSLLKRIY